MVDHTRKTRLKVSPAARRREIVEALKSVAARVGPEISLARFYRETGISGTQVYLYFERWGDVRRLAGLPANVDRSRLLSRHSRQRLLEQLHESIGELGTELREIDFYNRTGVSPTTIHKLCGGWLELKRAAGLTPVRAFRPRYTREELRERLKALVEERGDITLEAFCTELKISMSTLARIVPWTDLRRSVKFPIKARTGRPLWQCQLAGDVPSAFASPDGTTPDPLEYLPVKELLRLAKDCRRRDQQSDV